MKNPLGLASCFYKTPARDRWAEAVAAGFTDAELDLPNDLSVEDTLAAGEALYQEITAGGMAVTSIHLPFGDEWDVSALDGTRRRQAIRDLCLILDWAGERQIGIAVLHPSYEPIPEPERAERLESAAQAVRELSSHARAAGVAIAVENLPRSCLGNCADDMLLLTDSGKTAGICMDVNHLLIESHRDFIAKTGPYVITTHLSDYDRVNERHWLPGDGCIDWKELYQLFQGVGYQGRYLFELGEASSPSLMRVFTAAELAARFREISQYSILS